MVDYSSAAAGAVLRLISALLLCATLRPAAADAGAQGSNGSYFRSHLVSPKSEPSCPPGIGPMYRAAVIVTGTDMRQRPWGYAQTLREVLVKTSGDPQLEDDRRVAALAAHADRFVACFSYVDLMAGEPLHDDQATADRPHRLTVDFDPAKIDAVLATLGEKPWRGVRPVIVPVVLVHGRTAAAYLLSADNPAAAEQRGSFATAADQFGMAVRVPTEAALRAWGAGASHLPSRLLAPTAGDAIVLGTLEWSETLPGWVGKCRMRWHGSDYAWGISGVNYDAAFRNIVRGVMLVASGAGPPDHGN